MRHALRLLVTVMATAMFLSLAAGEVTVTLRPVVSVASERATLSEVAELSGDAALIAVIRDLPVVELPDLRERELEAGEIRRAIGHGLGSAAPVGSHVADARSQRRISCRQRERLSLPMATKWSSPHCVLQVCWWFLMEVAK
jgi:hypothetical protein